MTAATDPPPEDLRHHATVAPDRVVVICGDQRLSYRDLEALANRLAGVFRGCGLQRGDHVATLVGNRAETLALAWAAWRSGVYLTPMATSLVVGELAYLVDDCDARLVIAEAAHAETAAQLPARTERPVRWLSLDGAIAGFEPIDPLLAAASPQPGVEEPPGALMLYTSGTTGAPKGVWRPLLPADFRGSPPFAVDLIDIFGLGGPEVRYLSTAPMYHAAPLRFSFAVIAGGGTVVVMPRFDAAEALRLLHDERITHSQWVPSMFQRLCALPDEQRAGFAAPAHRTAIHAAAPCPAPLKRRMIDWWGPILVEYYAGSESIGMTVIDSAEWLSHPGSVGRARKGELHIVDEAGAELPPGATGLVCFSGMTLFEYHKAPEKTAAKRTLQGWQTLGDVGHVDDDGYLYLTDRQDDMIIAGGVNIYPQEIEAALREAEGVFDCAVVGVSDERFGERPLAFVVRQGDSGDAESFVAALHRHCEQHLGRFKRPVAFELIDELPRSPTGKVLRRVLRERLAARLRPAAAAPA